MAAPRRVINAAGKLTALGGSAQSAAVAAAQAEAARHHVDLAELRRHAGESIAALTGAEAACVTTGAAAGIAIAVAALATGGAPSLVRMLPATAKPCPILLQAGHAVNFGASVEQMIRIGGGTPVIVGDANSVPEALLAEMVVRSGPAGLLYVQSHHSVQDNMVSLPACVRLCREAGVPVIVDAAAEEDLTRYVAAGADLVIYSGGKAFGGPTAGFICGRANLVQACEAQGTGIARTMKVGKESIAGLLAALTEYTTRDEAARDRTLRARNTRICDALAATDVYALRLVPDEAGRAFERVAVAPHAARFDIRDLVRFLVSGEPSVRTRNHHLDQGYTLIDPRELQDTDCDVIVARLLAFAATL